jgi:RAB6A-GEF complex partner protein 2
MSLKLPLPQGFSFLKSVGWFEDKKADPAARQQLSPTWKLQTDKEVYRPGDSVTVTIEISCPSGLKDDTGQIVSGEDVPSLLLDSLSFELKGIEKLDSQWFSVPKPLPGSKQRRGILWLPSYRVNETFPGSLDFYTISFPLHHNYFSL